MDDHADLVREHRRFAFRVARGVARKIPYLNAEDVKDLEQESLIGLLAAAKTWDPSKGCFTTWAWWKCRAACQLGLKKLRPGGINSWHGQVVVPLLDRESVSDPWSAMEESNERGFNMSSVLDACTRLIPMDSESLLRHHLHGETMESIASGAGVSRERIRQRVVRATERVRAEVLER